MKQTQIDVGLDAVDLKEQVTELFRDRWVRVSARKESAVIKC